MDQTGLEQRLSRITTLWSVIFQAHQGTADAAQVAQGVLIQRYCGAVYRYLLGAVRDPDTASDLCQEFALRFVRGDFRRADPQRGRFRDYLKTALVHLVNDHHRCRQRSPQQLGADSPEPAAPQPESADSDRAFLLSWRAELLARTWKTLDEINPAYHAVLLSRIDNPDLSNTQLADLLGNQRGKKITPAAFRKTLQRAHEKYAELLLDEVMKSLETPTIENLRQELHDLDLLRHCQSVLEMRETRRPHTAP